MFLFQSLQSVLPLLKMVEISFQPYKTNMDTKCKLLTNLMPDKTDFKDISELHMLPTPIYHWPSYRDFTWVHMSLNEHRNNIIVEKDEYCNLFWDTHAEHAVFLGLWQSPPQLKKSGPT